MTADRRLQVIRRTVAELSVLEGDVAGKLERTQQLSSRHPDTLAAIQRLRPMIQEHRDQLSKYLNSPGGTEMSLDTTMPHPASTEATTLSDELQEICLTFHRCALNYAVLYEVALQLYEPRLREIAPKHMKAHADAALSTARLLPAVVAWQLTEDGLFCRCVCPMCSIGACGCVALGTQTLNAAWCDASPTQAQSPGIVLQIPRPGSELALAGVQGGELLLAVDGQHVRTTDEIQAVIRKHALGDEVRILIQSSAESPREVIVRHVSDYPKE
jgi:hypothetical protein